MTQQEIADHPLAKFGHHRPPFWLWRLSPRLCVIRNALRDIWLIATGRCTLHVAWQEGHFHGTQSEYRRIIVNGGELVPYVSALREARGAIWELGAWKSRDAFERDPSIKAIDAILKSPPWNKAPVDMPSLRQRFEQGGLMGGAR